MFWHELVAAGIGGRTIAEAKANMSWDEARDWGLYLKHYGGVNRVRSIEHSGALVAAMVSRLGGGKARYEDFLPKRAPTYQEGSIQHVLAMMKGTARG